MTLNLFNKNSTIKIDNLLKKKFLSSNNKIKSIARTGTKNLIFIDNYINIINYHKNNKRAGEIFKMQPFLINCNSFVKNYNFFIFIKNKTKMYKAIDFIIHFKKTNNFVLLKPQRGSFKVYSNGLIGLVSIIEVKKIIKITTRKKKLIFNSILLLQLYKKFLIIRFPSKINKFSFRLSVYRKKIKSKCFLFFNIVTKKKNNKIIRKKVIKKKTQEKIIYEKKKYIKKFTIIGNKKKYTYYKNLRNRK